LRRAAAPIVLCAAAGVVALAFAFHFDSGPPSPTPRVAGGDASSPPADKAGSAAAKAHPSAGATEHESDPAPCRAELVPETARPAVVGGIVRTKEDGKIVADGRVRLVHVDFRQFDLDARAWQALSPEEQIERQFHARDVAIREDGTFRLELPAPGVLRGALVQPLLGERDVQFLESTVELPDLELVPGGFLHVELAVDEGGTLSGVVVDAGTGLPIEGARVMAPWWHEEESDWGSDTDAEGRFRIAGIDPVVAAAGSSELAVEAAGHLPTRVQAPAPERGIHVEGLRIALKRGVVVRGRIVPSTAAVLPLHWLELWLLRREAGDATRVVRQLDFLRHAQATPAGGFEFDAAPAARDVALEVDGSFPPIERPGLDLAVLQEEVVFPLPDSWVLTDLDSMAPEIASRRDGWVAWIEPADGTRRARPWPTSWRAPDRILVERGSPTRFVFFALEERPGAGTWVERTEVVCAFQGADADGPSGGSAVFRQRGRIDHLPEFGSAADDAAVGVPAGLGLVIELSILRAGDQPLAATRVSVVDPGGGDGEIVTTDDAGRARVQVGLGRRFLCIRVAGYASEYLEVSARAPGRAAFRLALRRPLG
jgi:hypothetical protein